MLSDRDGQRLTILLCLLIAASAQGIPTIRNCDTQFASCHPYQSPGPRDLPGLEVSEPFDGHDFPFSVAGAAVLEPRSGSGYPAAASSVRVRPLPAVPQTLLMVLAGFLCISLIRDRRAWLGAFVSLLWLGQAGFSVLPRVHSLLRSGKQVDPSVSNSSFLFAPEGLYHLCAGTSDTRYTDLLRRVAAMPDGNWARFSLPMFALPFEGRGAFGLGKSQVKRGSLGLHTVTCQQTQTLPASREPSSGQGPVRMGLHRSVPIASPGDLPQAAAYLALKPEWFACTSLGFVSAQLPRGPPLAAPNGSFIGGGALAHTALQIYGQDFDLWRNHEKVSISSRSNDLHGRHHARCLYVL